jgi:hypothetical protein
MESVDALVVIILTGESEAIKPSDECVVPQELLSATCEARLIAGDGTLQSTEAMDSIAR